MGLGKEMLANISSKILASLNNPEPPPPCVQCGDEYGGVSCELHPDTLTRVAIFPEGIKLPLPPEEYECPIVNAVFHEQVKVREKYLKDLRDKLTKITPKH